MGRAGEGGGSEGSGDDGNKRAFEFSPQCGVLFRSLSRGTACSADRESYPVSS